MTRSRGVQRRRPHRARRPFPPHLCRGGAQDGRANAGGALVIQAGTATSTRLRNSELQSFNWIHAHRNNEVDLQVIAWDGSGFRPRQPGPRYTYDGDNWHSRPVVEEAPPLEAAAPAIP